MNLKVRISQAGKLAASERRTYSASETLNSAEKRSHHTASSSKHTLFVCLPVEFCLYVLLTEWNCKVTKRKEGKKAETHEHESSLISIGRIAFWRRLPD